MRRYSAKAPRPTTPSPRHSLEPTCAALTCDATTTRITRLSAPRRRSGLRLDRTRRRTPCSLATLAALPIEAARGEVESLDVRGAPAVRRLFFANTAQFAANQTASQRARHDGNAFIVRGSLSRSLLGTYFGHGAIVAQWPRWSAPLPPDLPQWQVYDAGIFWVHSTSFVYKALIRSIWRYNAKSRENAPDMDIE